MAEIAVPRAELAEMLGLPADVDDEALRAAMDKVVADLEAQRRAVAAQDLHEADKGLVATAIAQRKIAPARQQRWLEGLKADREGTLRVLASLPGPPDISPRRGGAPDADLERAHNRVMASLGFKDAASSAQADTPRAVAASSGFGRQAGEVLPSPLPAPGIPPPVRIRVGKPVKDWTQRERDDALQRKLGPAFHGGTNPPPGGDFLYFPSPSDHSEYVHNGDRTGFWREKSIQQQPYREI
jgi:hypothetical protein